MHKACPGGARSCSCFALVLAKNWAPQIGVRSARWEKLTSWAKGLARAGSQAAHEANEPEKHQDQESTPSWAT